MPVAVPKFKSELALVRGFLDFVDGSGKPGRTFTTLEFEVGYGIADIVFFRLRAHSKALRQNFLKLPARLAVLFNDWLWFCYLASLGFRGWILGSDERIGQYFGMLLRYPNQNLRRPRRLTLSLLPFLQCAHRDA